MDVHNQRSMPGPENSKTQSKLTLNNSNANSRNLSVMYANADNLINKRGELLKLVSAIFLKFIIHLI